MGSLATSLIIFACLFSSIVLGLYVRGVMPKHHLDSDSKDTIKLATGLIATLSALVLGLLVSSARDTFNQASGELMQTAVKVVQLDRILAQYGPEAKGIRDQLKSNYTNAADLVLSGDQSRQMQLDTPDAAARVEGVQTRIRGLAPKNDLQRGLQSRALEISEELAGSRWLLIMSNKRSVSAPLLVVLVFWLSLIFTAWALFAPRNMTVAVALFACALSVSGATFLILEMDHPLTGAIRVSGEPVREALSHLGQ